MTQLDEEVLETRLRDTLRVVAASPIDPGRTPGVAALPKPRVPRRVTAALVAAAIVVVFFVPLPHVSLFHSLVAPAKVTPPARPGWTMQPTRAKPGFGTPLACRGRCKSSNCSECDKAGSPIAKNRDWGPRPLGGIGAALRSVGGYGGQSERREAGGPDAGIGREVRRGDAEIDARHRPGDYKTGGGVRPWHTTILPSTLGPAADELCSAGWKMTC